MFCGEDRTLSREHVIPAWIARLVLDGSEVVELELQGKNWSTGNPYAVTLRAVCAPCNNGWMAELESDVRPILSSLIVDDPGAVRIAPDEATLVAWWAAKTALVVDRVTFGESFLGNADTSLIADSRIAPSQWTVRLGRRVEFRPSTERPFVVTEVRSRQQRQAVRHSVAHLVTLAVGHVVLHISAQELRTTVAITRSGIPDDVLIPIHPTPAKAVAWPPSGGSIRQTDLDFIFDGR